MSGDNLTAEQRARAMMGGQRGGFGSSPAGAAHLAAKAEALRVRGEPHGLSPAQVAAADVLKMSLAKYAAYANVITIEDRERAETRLRAADEARQEAERQVAIEQARKAL